MNSRTLRELLKKGIAGVRPARNVQPPCRSSGRKQPDNFKVSTYERGVVGPLGGVTAQIDIGIADDHAIGDRQIKSLKITYKPINTRTEPDYIIAKTCGAIFKSIRQDVVN